MLYKMKYNVIIPAAGHSNRFSKTKDKLLSKINNEKIIVYSIAYFNEDQDCEKIIIPTSEKNFKLFKQMFCLNSKIIIIKGGSTRSQSVKNGFEYVNKNCENILIHDGARPFISKALIENIKDGISSKFDCVIPYIDIFDSLFNIEKKLYVNREHFKIIQTPQAFKRKILEDAYNLNNNIDEFHDELSLVINQNKNLKINFIQGCSKNKKITILSDLD